MLRELHTHYAEWFVNRVIIDQHSGDAPNRVPAGTNDVWPRINSKLAARRSRNFKVTLDEEDADERTVGIGHWRGWGVLSEALVARALVSYS